MFRNNDLAVLSETSVTCGRYTLRIAALPEKTSAALTLTAD
jgi:hypothetical protein